ARSGAVPRRDGADRQKTGSHSRRRQSFLSMEHERAGNVSTTGGAPGSDPRVNRTHGTQSNRLLLRLGSYGVPQPAGDGARRDSRREAVSGLVERVVGGPGGAD